MENLSRREKFKRVVRREMEGYVPFEFELCPSLKEEFRKRTGREDYEDYYEMPLRFIRSGPLQRDVDFSPYFGDEYKELDINPFGIGRKAGSVAHFTEMVPPMKHFETVAEFETYPYPDPEEDWDWENFPKQVEALKAQDYVPVAGMAVTIFEISWYMRGMDRLMIDMMTEPELAEVHMDRITEIRCECAKRYVESGVDVLQLGDDIATQRDMMMSPEMWRKFLKPRLKEVIDAAREVNPAIIIDYHSDGNVSQVVPELIEIGVDVLNPVQPECMDPVEMKRMYGNRLSFRGTVGTQTTMPFGTPEEVEETCKRMIEEVGKDGGLVLAPTHMLEPEVPWANIEAMLTAIEKYSTV